MKRFLPLLLIITALSHCGGGATGQEADCCADDGNNSSNACSANQTVWSNLAITLSTGGTRVASASVIFDLSATADKDIAAYLIGESTTAPAATDAGWIDTVAAQTHSLVNIDYTLTDTTDGAKTVYAWFKDECGSVSSSASLAFTLDATAPTASLLIDNGAKFTLEADLNVDLTLTATDADGIASWAITDTNTQPPVDNGTWHDVDTTSLNVTTTTTLDTPLHSHFRYAWIKDKAGNVRAVSDEIEVMRFFRDTGPTNNGRYTSIAVDSTNTAYCTSYNSQWGILNLNYKSLSLGDALDLEEIDPPSGIAGDYGKGTSLTIDGDDNFYVAYRDEDNGKLKYSTNASGVWVAATIEDGGNAPNLAVDVDGFAHIMHQTDTTVRYVTNQSGSWVGTTVYTDNNPNNELKMRLAADGSVHAVYSSQIPNKLMHFTNETAVWVADAVIDFIGAPQARPNINFKDGDLIVSYSQGDGKFYFIDKKEGQDWGTPEQITNRYGFPSDLFVDSEGTVHVLYYASSTHDLLHATKINGVWVNTTIDADGDVGDHNAMAIDSNDRLHISYYDATNTVLVYATTADDN